MGLLVNGIWQKEDSVPKNTTLLRNWITPNGEAGRSGTGGYKAEAGRYHLYVALSCPFAHRTLLLRKIKGLDSIIDVSVVHPVNTEFGWKFATDFPKTTGDLVNGKEYLKDVYVLGSPEYTGRVSVPVLWDKKTGTIVNNESIEIAEIFDSAFDDLPGVRSDLHLFPLDEDLYKLVIGQLASNQYKALSAKSQDAYDTPAKAVFATLTKLDELLAKKRYLSGTSHPSAIDVVLYVILVRFDPAYATLARLDHKRVNDYLNLGGYIRDLWQNPEFQESTNLDHIRQGSFGKITDNNPYGIVPIGPELNWEKPSGREHL